MTRTAALQSLLSLDKPLGEVWSTLSAYPWDSDCELAMLFRAHVTSVLDRFIANALSASEVENWANAIEGREDIGFEPSAREVLKDIIWELANPVLTYTLDHDSAKRLIGRLNA